MEESQLAAGGAALRRQYSKLCDPRDFDDPDVLRMLKEILPERDPRSHVERKAWEFAMLALFLEETGRLVEQTTAVGVGAGDERVLFWLTNRIGRVIATDIYGSGDFAEREAASTMLIDPASHAPFPYREDRLEVLASDARALALPDASADVVFSLSSFEHFGTRRDIAAAAAEVGRVLAPGGHALIAVDTIAKLHPLDSAPADFARRLLSLGTRFRRATPWQRARLGEALTPAEVRRWIVEPSGLLPLQALDTQLAPGALGNVADVAAGRLEPASGELYPHVLLRAGRSLFTSACVVLRKNRGLDGVIEADTRQHGAPPRAR